jgi:hypothetical protein
MTLAVVLSVCSFFWAPISGLETAPDWSQSAAQEAPQSKPAETSSPSPASATPQTPTPPATNKPSAASGTKSKTKKSKGKKNNQAKCADTSAGNNSPSAASGSGAATTSGGCPPPITVVHDGGTADPAVQLTGESAAAQAPGKHPADQLVGTTEENLKKIEGRELSPSQKEMLTQIHQFLEQSKAATAAGDIDRGHNLALKAHLLSDELTKP